MYERERGGGRRRLYESDGEGARETERLERERQRQREGGEAAVVWELKQRAANSQDTRLV